MFSLTLDEDNAYNSSPHEQSQYKNRAGKNQESHRKFEL